MSPRGVEMVARAIFISLDQPFDQVSDDGLLFLDQLLDALIREIQERIERVATERQTLRRSLDLYELSRSCLDDVHVDLCPAVVVVREIEKRFAIDDPDADRGDVVDERDRGDCAFVAQLLERQR